MQRMQFQAPPMSKTNKVILITVVSLFILNSISNQFLGFSLQSILALSSNGVFSGKLYQLITYSLMETSFFGVLFNCLLLWFIGGDLETRWSSRFYKKFMLFTVLVSAILYSIIGKLMGGSYDFYAISGLTGLNYAFLVAYGIIHKDRSLNFMLIFPIKAKYFCMLIIGVELYMSVFGSNALAAIGHLLAMGVGFGYLKFKSLKISSLKNKARRKSKANLHIVPDDKPNKNEPKYWQ